MLLLFSLHSDLVSRAMDKRLSVDLVSPYCLLSADHCLARYG